MTMADPLYTIFDGGRRPTPPTPTSTPGHHQDLTLCGTVTVLLKHPAGGIRGVVLKVEVGEPALEIAVLARTWPAGVCPGARLWVRGHLANESISDYKRATHFVVAQHLALVRGPRSLAS
ncbi:MAG TPA: hypothetical protein VGC99_28815 [Candidatus Tectomicrobia bacterium]